ncbi:unnamed protein product, partial [marine sediment metagenome]
TVPAAAVSLAAAITASPTIAVTADAVAVDDAASGGFWDDFERELTRRQKDKKERLKRKEKAKKLADKLHRELALAERAIEDEAERKAELARINRLVANSQQRIIALGSERLNMVMAEALERQTFSTMERLERSLIQVREEEQFLLMATQILVNQ